LLLVKTLHAGKPPGPTGKNMSQCNDRGSAVMRAAMAAALFAGAFTLAAPAFADRPEGKGRGKHSEGKHEGRHGDGGDRDGDRDGDRRGEHRGERRSDARFESRDRDLVRVYYVEQERGGRCPPGLRKKHHGCMPPGHAKKWSKGRPLPRDVVFYEVPQPLVVQLGMPPAGYKYVRVASDILLITLGSSMVVDAIQDLGRI
jgi:Ni/Co efflux regulator RcnB